MGDERERKRGWRRDRERERETASDRMTSDAASRLHPRPTSLSQKRSDAIRTNLNSHQP